MHLLTDIKYFSHMNVKAANGGLMKILGSGNLADHEFRIARGMQDILVSEGAWCDKYPNWKFLRDKYDLKIIKTSDTK